jgi:hypothetical protein
MTQKTGLMQLLASFYDNLKRYIADKPLKNVLTRKQDTRFGLLASFTLTAKPVLPTDGTHQKHYSTYSKKRNANIFYNMV